LLALRFFILETRACRSWTGWLVISFFLLILYAAEITTEVTNLVFFLIFRFSVSVFTGDILKSLNTKALPLL
jgi:hypothetical protein